MALLEPNKIIASSLDNFLILSNTHYTSRPYVEFTLTDFGFTTDIVFQDADDPENYSLTINGKVGNSISYQTFNTATSIAQATLNLLEALKLNNITYNVTLRSSSTIRAYLDTSRNYKIYSSNAKVTITDAFSGYDVNAQNKIVLNIRTDVGEFNLEKYVASEEVPFKVSSIFDSLNLFSPTTMNMLCYSVYNNEVEAIGINNAQITSMPTTLTKFETIDYDLYYIDSAVAGVKKFLTNRSEIPYNYDEYFTLSLITNYALGDINLLKKYYTNSGVFLTSETGQHYKEKNNIRLDFYDYLNLLEVENAYGKQVGYVDIVATNGTTELTEGIRFIIKPRCTDNKVLWFVNKIGGVDSFNFTSSHSMETKIKENEVFYRNNIAPMSDTYVIENVRKKNIETTYTYSTHQLKSKWVEYLTELQRSKYVYIYDPEDNSKYICVVDDFNIDYDYDDKYSNLEIEFHISDENKDY